LLPVVNISRLKIASTWSIQWFNFAAGSRYALVKGFPPIQSSHLITSTLQNDDWGKQGKSSMAAQLWSKTPGNPGIDDSKHYSEVCQLLTADKYKI